MADVRDATEDTKFVEIYENEIVLRDEKNQQAISIDRKTSIVTKKSIDQVKGGSGLCTFPFRAVYGIVDLFTSKYLVLITSAKCVGDVLASKVYSIERVHYVPIDSKIQVTSAKNLPFDEEDRAYIDMLDTFFSKKFLYFSFDYDLTSTLQTSCETNFAKGKSKSQYFFNEIHLQDFFKANLIEWIVPVISGMFEKRHVHLGDTEVDFILISRRDKRRSGMRYVSRGCDLEGNASNTADTEQILVIYKKNSIETKVLSHVQLRGSIPFLWRQKPDLKWEPKGDIYSENQNVAIARKHFDMIVKDYGNQVCINLVDKKRTQQKLGLEFQRVVDEISKDGTLKYVWFDFHAECRKMKYENLSRLLTMVETDTNTMGMFEADIKRTNNNTLSATIHQKQKGTFRTNCMDCLDRTNVVQSVIGRKMLHFMLIHSKLSDKSAFNLAPFEKLPDELETLFREIWTLNADALSYLYTGTGALKTDFTRTGKRSKQGALQDGRNSIMRYVKNHFYDGYNQNCIDLVLGKYKPKSKVYVKQKINNFFVLGFLVLATPIFFVLLFNSFASEPVEQTPLKTAGVSLKSMLIGTSIFGLSFFVVLKAIITNPYKFIERPIMDH